MSLQIIEKYLPEGHPNRPGIKLIEIKARVWHGTANFKPGATDLMNVGYASRAYKKRWNNIKNKWDYFEVDEKTPFVFGSAHVYIDVDSATIAIPLDEIAYNCGDRPNDYNNGYKGQTKLAHDIFNNKNNNYTWSIELCMNNMNKWDLVCDNAIEFVKQYMPGLQIEDYRHYDVTGKICPSPFVNLFIKELDPKWIMFKNKVKEALKEGK